MTEIIGFAGFICGVRRHCHVGVKSKRKIGAEAGDIDLTTLII